ncbi:sulfite exporter TauE/SafE family protein [Rhizobium sp. S95]|uniref:Probable membrane transporter protein n=1 Tax=Ciceribacter sichuanensis TaxID=2949647 RepID=A0AAJ1BW14_9HYPH|nr:MULTISPECIES: sulfite exporter TauE/SafE family protein [unclassified Ciceribacter]MCM2396477.1 sulfite exporter TauE/SafE family protein [Ciceribacter sp. S95]MCO5957372.1 sulfite exporter TauE/SafE family protein [Ciceribacter sp. S101]
MPIATILLLFAAGFFSGVVNAIAGGGTFLTFGALTLAGLPPIAANATSSITQFPGYVTSTLAYIRELKSFWQGAVVLALVSAAGAFAGALLLVSLSNPTFRAMVPWLLIAATAVFAAGPKLRPKTAGEGHPATPLGLVLQTLTAFYGGFFGAGMGIMMLASLGLASGGDYHRLNALKNFLSIVIAAVAIAVFATAGAVSWTHALVMVPAVALGGYAGVSLARRVPQSILRFLVVAAGLLLAVYYFLTG